MLIGNVGKDPEIRTSSTGNTLANVSLATTKRFNDKDGHSREKTEWHQILLANRGKYKMGEITERYVRKGSRIYVEGELETQKWKGNDGIERWTTKINASEIKLLDSKKDRIDSMTQQNQQRTHHPGLDDPIVKSSPIMNSNEFPDPEGDGIPF